MDFELSELLKLLSIIRLATYRSRNVFTDSADEALSATALRMITSQNALMDNRAACLCVIK
jgi:hypothetical protein